MNFPIDLTDKELRTERLVLRAWRESDLEDFYAYARVDGVGQAAGWLPHKDREESRAILTRFIDGKHEFAITLGGKAIGSLGIHDYGEVFGEFSDLRGKEIGFVLSKEHWGKGYMTEAVRAVIRYLFEEEKTDFILCGHFSENERSRRVQKKCGFVPYRSLVFDTHLGQKKPGILNLLLRDGLSPLSLCPTHPETLILAPFAKTAEELVRDFCAAGGQMPEHYETWQFGENPDRLAGLVCRGEKTATSSALACYAAEGETPPHVGDVSVILNSAGFAVAILQNTAVRALPFSEVDEDFARKEGEGDRSLAEWRRVHTAFFTKELAQIGATFTEQSLVLCEEFRVLYTPSYTKQKKEGISHMCADRR